MPRHPALSVLFAAAIAATLLTTPTLAARDLTPRPARLHVAWLDGRTLEQAMATGAELLDRFPDAVLVANEASLARLRAAGFRIDGPIALPAHGMITLLRSEGHGQATLDASQVARVGAQVLWRGGDDWLIASEGTLPESEGLLPHHRKVLRERSLRKRTEITTVERSPGGPTLNVTSFSPVVQQMVDQVSGPTLIQMIGQLAGKFSVNVGGVPTSFVTRSTPTALCDKAEQYVFERFQAMGYADVAYDPFTFSSVSARNVVATKPGDETPNRVVILGAHLDSTSPVASTNAPGANDNASGTAGLLMIAEILKNYSFKNTIKFIAFTGEEQGLFGSEHYADAAAARGDSIVGVVIFDMIGWRNLNHKIDIEGESAWLPLMNVMNDACAQYTTLAADLVLFSFGSDHVPFQDNNFPAFLAIEDEYEDFPCYHQTCDTTGWNQTAIQSDVVRAGLATIAHVAVPRVFLFSHTPLENTANTTGPYEVVTSLTTSGALVPDSLLLHWSNGGPEVAQVMTAISPPGNYHAFIPGQPSGTTVRYWMSARDDANRLAVSPDGAPAVVHQFLVSSRTTLLAEGFETGATGWTSGGTGNDWQVAAPAGLAEDPTAAFAGAMIAGTDITGLGANLGRYEPFTNSWFESPAVDCSQATDVQLSFMRKLATDKSDGGTWDAALVWVNGTLVWSNPATTPLIDANWTAQSFNVGSIADGNPSVKVRFGMRSNATVHYGGWNLDEVKLTAYTPLLTGVEDAAPSRGVVLHTSMPNPAHAGATLRFELPSRATVGLAIYDVRGRLVRSLVRGARDAGAHEVRWDGRDGAGALAATGVYFYRLETLGQVRARRLVLIQ
ncbi:MAG: M20/M25/M40 family metallo-hydrolase [Candidatus Eisenbacteria bacterium]|uniref:M20/M25/M40 family metallo-hydrolase n=1 Tax=Eiseniibacteriota bacterium TaxID=2212470 RepID=A0A849SK55_UNCEI|nr:M20/M25/M40 family metallo-hydrolase [Candidatus Eisenbacteria bacterium]